MTDPAAAQLLRDLTEISTKAAQTERTLDDLRARRVTAFRDLRGHGVTFAKIAEAAGVTEAAVHQAMRKARAADERAAAP